MANENDELKEEGQENTGEQPQHKSWIGKILEQIDTDFPLSGGEEEEDFENVNEATGDDEEPEEHKKSSFFEDLDTDFPLSGGEVDHDE